MGKASVPWVSLLSEKGKQVCNLCHVLWIGFVQNVKTFKDVKGCDDAKQELEEVVEYLRNPGKFTRLGGKLPKVCAFYIVYDFVIK